MPVKGLEGMSNAQVVKELKQGGKFVIFQYCISIVILTFRRSSDIYFIKKDGSALSAGLPYTLVSLVLGWWGIPWGPIYTIGTIATNLGGGKDVTKEVFGAFGK